MFRSVFLHPDQLLTGSDIVRLQSPFKWVQKTIWDQGHFPLWDPTMLGGRSIVGDPLSAVLSPLGWMFWLSAAPVLFGLYMWAFVTLGAWGLFLWTRALRAEAAGSFLAACAFAFSGKAAASLFAGHMETLPTMMAAPWIFWATERLLQSSSLGNAILLGGIVSIAATLGHVPTLYWHLLFAGLYAAVQLIPSAIRGGLRAIRTTLVMFGASAIVFMLGAMALWLPVARQTLLLSARTGETAGDFSFSTMGSAAPADLLRIASPFEGMTLPQPLASDADNQFFWETASYPGLLALALALCLVLVAPRNRRTILFGLLALLALLLALGSNTPLYRVIYGLIPGMKMQRVPGRLLYYFDLFVAAMAALSLGELVRVPPARRRLFAFSIGALILVVVAGHKDTALMGASFAGSHAQSLTVLGSLLLVAILFFTSTVSGRALGGLLIAVSLIDLGAVWSLHVFTAEPARLVPGNSVADFLAHQGGQPFRFFDPTQAVPQQLAARLGLESATGYHPGIYEEQLSSYHALWPAGEGSSIVELLMHSPKSIVNMPLFELMNVRYVVAYEPNLDDRFKKVFTTPAGEMHPQRNVFEVEGHLPRAFVVGKALAASGSATDLKTLATIDPRESCLLAGDPVEGGASYQPLSATAFRSGEMEFSFRTDAPGTLLVSSAWHPDWVATDSNRPIGVRRADYGFLGVPISPGEHVVRLWYRPWDFYLGCLVSAVFWTGLGAAFLIHRFIPGHDRKFVGQLGETLHPSAAISAGKEQAR